MTGKEKLYFLLNRINDKRVLTASGQPVLIHPQGDLRGHYPRVELLLLLKKLQDDEKVIKVVRFPVPKEERYIYQYEDDYYGIEVLPTFDKYFQKVQQEPEYQEFTGKKPTPETEIQRLYEKIAEMDKQIKIRRDALVRAQSSINKNPFYSEATRVGHLAKLEQQAQTDIGNFIKQKETYLKELSLRKADIQILKSPQVKPQTITSTKVTYDPKKGVLDVEGKKVKFKRDSFRAKLLELLLKDSKSTKKEWSWDEVIEEIEGITDIDILKENKKKFYSACDGLSKHIAQKIGVNDLLIYSKSTVQVNSKYL
jgi:hypothetical protein